MLENGEYSVWFNTPTAQGTGVVTLTDGQIAGQDSVIAYSGSYDQDGDRFTALVQARRFCEGQPSVFGVDEFELKLTGKSTRSMVICSGTIEQAPGVSFEATLIRRCDLSPSKAESSVPKIQPFDIKKFPKVLSGR
jgi:hypothetical protein